ncbi:hypothetical protein Dsin_014378 [Dipteronia sinensis]|uniref:DUF4283 domain-containing protein n=1 Tax=Dipteronia sinensis TaxID=43782 RepID=A0AAE0ALT4_9ROSI|nr:hypothetical protein Dsin_014378 [Dipteronia sinensis]
MEVCPQNVVAKSRPVWVELYGIPLRCWNGSFFLQMGKVLGVPLLIEEATLLKKRLDRGRILVLLPYEFDCQQKITAVEQSRSFVVQIIAEASTANYGWISRHLGLTSGDHKAYSESVHVPKKWGRWSEKFESQMPLLLAQKISDKRDGNPKNKSGFQEKKRHEVGRVSHNCRNVRSQELKRDDNPYLPQYEVPEVEESYTVKIVVEKGKEALKQRKFNTRLRASRVCNTTLNLEKTRVVSSEDKDSYASSDFTERMRWQPEDCSNRVHVQTEHGPPNLGYVVGPNSHHQQSYAELGDDGGPADGGFGPSHNVSRVAESELESSLNRPDNPTSLDQIMVAHEPLQHTTTKERTSQVLAKGIKERQCQVGSREEAIQLEIDLGLPTVRREEVSQNIKGKDSHVQDKMRGSRNGGVDY